MNLFKATIATAAVITCCLGNEMPAKAQVTGHHFSSGSYSWSCYASSYGVNCSGPRTRVATPEEMKEHAVEMFAEAQQNYANPGTANPCYTLTTARKQARYIKAWDKPASDALRAKIDQKAKHQYNCRMTELSSGVLWSKR